MVAIGRELIACMSDTYGNRAERRRYGNISWQNFVSTNKARSETTLFPGPSPLSRWRLGAKLFPLMGKVGIPLT